MTKQKKIMSVAAILLLAAIAAGVAAFALRSPEAPPSKPEAAVTRQKPKKNVPRRKVSQRRGQQNAPAAGTSVKIPQGKEKPNLMDADDEANLTAAERAILAELQAGLDANSLRSVTKVVEKIQKLLREKGPDAVPVELRAKAVEALGWFLPYSLAELIGFMADSDPDVLEDVMTKFESAIDGTELGDIALSDILKSVAKSPLLSEDALDSLFMGVESDMRNSVAISTYKEILKTGSEAAKSRVWESVADFTGEDNIHTVEQLDNWLKENPDDEGDEEFYGGDSNDSDDEQSSEGVAPVKSKAKSSRAKSSASRARANGKR